MHSESAETGAKYEELGRFDGTNQGKNEIYFSAGATKVSCAPL